MPVRRGSTVLYKDKFLGGLNVPNFSIIVKTVRLKWLQKYTSNSQHVWKIFFESFVEMTGFVTPLLLLANYDIKWFGSNGNIPLFYYEVLALWSKVGNTMPVPKEQCIWYNKDVLIQERPVLYQEFIEAGFWYFSDLIRRNNTLRPFSSLVEKGLSQTKFLQWAGIATAVKKIIHDATCVIFADLSDVIETKLCIGNQSLEEMPSKLLYNTFVDNEYGKDVIIQNVAKYLDNGHRSNWKIAYKVILLEIFNIALSITLLAV